MKKKILILITFITIGKLTYSQPDFREGFIIKNNNDTIYGLIEFKENSSNFRKCIFKKEVNLKKEVFSATDIKAYRYNNSKYYVSKLIDNNGGKAKEKVFLEFLINGIVDIYCYRELGDEQFFVDAGDGNLVKLKNETKEYTKNENSYFLESKEYIGVLKYIFKDSPTITQKAEYTPLSSKPLINIAKDYHNEICKDEECIIYEKKIPKFKVLLKAGPAIGFNKKEMIDSYDIPPYISYGAFISTNFPQLIKNFYINYKIVFGHIHYSNQFSARSTYNPLTRHYDISFQRQLLENSVNLVYEFPLGKINPTIKLGGYRTDFIKTKYSRKVESEWDWEKSYFTESTRNPFSDSDTGYLLGAGLILKNEKMPDVFLDFTYQRGYGTFESVSDGEYKSYSVNLGLRFGRL